jgi:hypothetical protein
VDVAALQALVVNLNFETHGVDVTVTKPTAERPIETRGIWSTTETLEIPGGLPGQRREPFRVMALKVSEVGEVPRETEIEAPARGADAARTWVVDGEHSRTHDHVKVILLPKSDCCE